MIKRLIDKYHIWKIRRFWRAHGRHTGRVLRAISATNPALAEGTWARCVEIMRDPAVRNSPAALMRVNDELQDALRYELARQRRIARDG